MMVHQKKSHQAAHGVSNDVKEGDAQMVEDSLGRVDEGRNEDRNMMTRRKQGRRRPQRDGPE